LKKYITIAALVFIGCYTKAQRASAYKYTYTFSPPRNPAMPYIIIDSLNNPKGLTSISGEVIDDSGRHVWLPTILLQQDGKKGRTFLNADGRIDTTIIDPGNYHLSVYAAAGYKPFDTNFFIGNNNTFHFEVMLVWDPLPTIYDIHSKVKLTPVQIEQIKACVIKKDNIQCSKKGVYSILIEI